MTHVPMPVVASGRRIGISHSSEFPMEQFEWPQWGLSLPRSRFLSAFFSPPSTVVISHIRTMEERRAECFGQKVELERVQSASERCFFEIHPPLTRNT